MSEELANLPIVEELGAQLLAGFRRREAGRRRWPAIRLTALSATAVAAGAIVFATQVGGGPSAAQAAARLLGTVARAAQHQPARLPGPMQFFFVKQRSTVLLPIRANGAGPLPARDFAVAQAARVVIDSWVAWSPTRRGAVQTVLRSVTFPTAAARARWVALGRPALYRTVVFSTRARSVAAIGERIPLAGNRSMSVAQLLALPTDAGKLYRIVFRRLSAVAAFDAATTLNLYPLRAPVRAALYRALARVRGIAAIGNPRSLGGRAVVALGAADGGVEDEIILDPRTGALLGSRTVVLATRSNGLALGTVRSQTFVVARAITDAPRPPRAAIITPTGRAVTRDRVVRRITHSTSPTRAAIITPSGLAIAH